MISQNKSCPAYELKFVYDNGSNKHMWKGILSHDPEERKINCGTYSFYHRSPWDCIKIKDALAVR